MGGRTAARYVPAAEREGQVIKACPFSLTQAREIGTIDHGFEYFSALDRAGFEATLKVG